MARFHLETLLDAYQKFAKNDPNNGPKTVLPSQLLCSIYTSVKQCYIWQEVVCLWLSFSMIETRDILMTDKGIKSLDHEKDGLTRTNNTAEIEQRNNTSCMLHGYNNSKKINTFEISVTMN